MITSSTTTPLVPDVVHFVPTKTLEKVWQQPSVGTKWCDCDDGDHALEYDNVLDALYEIGLREDDEVIAHPQVVRLCMELWRYEAVCEFFHLAVEDAAKRVHGVVTEEYPMEEGLAMTKDFSDHWNGCPEALCGGNWDEFGEMEFPRIPG